METKVGTALVLVLAYSCCFRDVVGMSIQSVDKIKYYSSYKPNLEGQKIEEHEFDSLCEEGLQAVNRQKGSGCPKFAAFTLCYTEPEEEEFNFNLLQCPTTSSPVYVFKAYDGSKKAFYEGTSSVTQKRGAAQASSSKRTRSKK